MSRRKMMTEKDVLEGFVGALVATRDRIHGDMLAFGKYDPADTDYDRGLYAGIEQTYWQVDKLVKQFHLGAQDPAVQAQGEGQ